MNDWEGWKGWGGVVVWVGVVGLSAPLGRPVALTLALSRLAGEGMVCGVLCFSLDSRVRGNDVGLAGRDGCCGIGGVVVMEGVGGLGGRGGSRTAPTGWRREREGCCGWGCCGEFRASPCSLRSRPPSLCEGGNGVLCFSLDSRVRGNDVGSGGMGWGEWGWGGVSRAIWGLGVVLCGVLRGSWACR